MNDTDLPGAADRAKALFTDWIEAGQMKGRVSYNRES